jgi:hypothetical protein
MDSCRELHAELAIISKLLYKNRNQHRRTPYFRLLERVRREHATLAPLRAQQRIRDAERMIATLQGNGESTSATMEYSSSDQLLILDNTVAATVGFMHASELVVKCATRVASLLAQGFFMPFALVMTAILAKLRSLTQKIIVTLLKITRQLQLLIVCQGCRGQPSFEAVGELVERCSAFLPLTLNMPRQHTEMAENAQTIVENKGKTNSVELSGRAVGDGWLRRSSEGVGAAGDNRWI